jgi:MSHA biogenesis protein MshG
MPSFAYKARDAAGALQTGNLDATDVTACADALLARGITPVDIRAQAAALKLPAFNLKRGARVGLMDLLLFSRQMHTLLKSGVPILSALAGLEDSALNPGFAALLREIRQDLAGGRELSSALRKHANVFSPFYLSMIRVGEMTGRLDDIFLRLYHYLDFERDTRERVKAALRYPMFVIVALVGAVIAINIFVIPAFAKVFAGFKAELPLMTKVLLGTSQFTVDYWPYLLALAIAAALGFRAWIHTPDGRLIWDRTKLRLPIAGKIINKSLLSRFARSFALAAKSGVPLVQALAVSAEVVDNAHLSARIRAMREGVERGESILRTAANAKVFTPVVLQMIAVGEETGELDNLMHDVAEMYEREVDYEIKTLSQQIEPILIVALGAMVLVLALGVFLPIWDLGKVAIK